MSKALDISTIKQRLAQAQQFQQQLEEWTVDNWGNKIDYKTFYPELLTFFRQLNYVDKPR